jgi:uncharacterized membrane protein YkoI
MRRWRPLIVVGGIVATGALVGGVALAAGAFDDDSPAERRSESEFTQAHANEADVTRDQAEAAALRERGGTVVESNLEDEGHGMAWEVAIIDGSALWEIQVDAQTGEVLGVESEGADEGQDDD